MENTRARKQLKPKEGEMFEVNFSEINRNIFKKERENSKQEKVRKLICEAFTKVDENPRMYGTSFKTLIPKKTWTVKTVGEYWKLANDLGGHIADWVEQSLEWAQRIANGETWEDVCNESDSANWQRIIEWKNGIITLVGGCKKLGDYETPASFVWGMNYYFYSDIIQNATPLVVKCSQRKMKPMEGIPFEVNPLEIDRDLFRKKRKNEQQERTRQLIWDAFDKMNEYPHMYGKPFKTLMPEKTWKYKTVDEFMEMANALGGHIADWVEQAFEWAQRIANGETWEDVCNKPDTANWYRLIKWKDGIFMPIGSSRLNRDVTNPPSDFSDFIIIGYRVYDTVPLIVI